MADDLEKLARSLGPGARLPSVRELCSNLKISLATLSTALRSLEAKGVIVRRHGSGIYVTSRVAIPRVAILASATHFLVGGSPVWGLLVGELLKGFREKGFEASFYLAQPADEAAKTFLIPPELELALGQGRVDGIVAVGMDESSVEYLMEAGLSPVSFAGPGSINCRMDVAALAGELAGSLVGQGRKSAMVVGCHHPSMYESVKAKLESAGLEVWPSQERIWSERSLTDRMATPFMHVGQEFAGEFLALVERGEAPDALFIMDDIFAHGFLMLWANGPGRDSVTLACLTNKELHMFDGWGIELGLMEVSVQLFTKAMVEAVAEGLANPDTDCGERAKAVARRMGGAAAGVIEDAPGRYTLLLKGRTQFVGRTTLKFGVT